jgi:hypothetical protein
MGRTLIRRFIRRHFVALPLCILVLTGAVFATVFASSGSTSAGEKRQIADVVTAWQRAEATLYTVPAALAPRVDALWAAKKGGLGTSPVSSGKAGTGIKLTPAMGDKIIRDYEAALARLGSPAFVNVPLTLRRRHEVLTYLREQLDLRGDTPLTHVSCAVSSVTDVEHTSAGPVVRVKAREVETYATGLSSTFQDDADYRMTRAADGRWLIADRRFLENDGPPPPSLVPWYWERWFLWALAVELALIGLGLVVKMAAEGTRPREPRIRGEAWSRPR